MARVGSPPAPTQRSPLSQAPPVESGRIWSSTSRLAVRPHLDRVLGGGADESLVVGTGTDQPREGALPVPHDLTLTVQGQETSRSHVCHHDQMWWRSGDRLGQALGGLEQSVGVQGATQAALPLTTHPVEKKPGPGSDRDLDATGSAVGGALDHNPLADVTFQTGFDLEVVVDHRTAIEDRTHHRVDIDQGPDEGAVGVGEPGVGVGQRAAAAREPGAHPGSAVRTRARRQ